jgi:hypothetical protein
VIRSQHLRMERQNTQRADFRTTLRTAHGHACGHVFMNVVSPQPIVSVSAAPMDPPIKNGVVGDWRHSDEDFLASFHLPGLAEKHETLKALNPLPRDARISFNEERHEYLIDGVKAPRSVTGLVHTYEGQDFDPYVAVRAMKNGSRWHEKREDYLTDDGQEMGDDEIVQLWSRRGNVASARGTLLHWHCEMHLNSRTLEHPHSPEFQMFLGILDVLQQQLGLRPFRTEVCLFHCGFFFVASKASCKE